MAPRLMRRCPVMLRAMPMRARRELVLHQQPAAAVPHDLAVGHAVAGADRLAREVHRCASLVGRAMVRARSPVMRPRSVMPRRPRVTVRAPCATIANVHPAVARPRAGHGRERRRWRQLLGFGRRRRRDRFGHGLRGRLGGRRLRAKRRCEHPERERCAGNDDDTLHDALPPFACPDATRELRSRIDRATRRSSRCERAIQPGRSTDWR